MRRVFLLVVLVLLGPYLRTAVYEFPEPAPFGGPAFFNPYHGLTRTWQRANLHAHGRPWAGLTSGRHTSDEVVDAYRRAGYSIAGVSDYQHIAALDGVDTLPLYEHGYNIGKRHQLAVGAHRVQWFDFPLGQSLSQQQLIIDLVARTSELVAIAHPEGRDAYSDDDMQRLTGYQLLEVLNGPFVAEKPWDAALSMGRPVWALGNDDNHDLNQDRRFGVAWNMIDAPSAATADIVQALRQGRSYAVIRTDEIPSADETTLADVEFRDGKLTVTSAGAPANIAFVGQHGRQRKSVRNVKAASYTFAPDDTYIRTVIYAPRTVMFLNPIFRYDGVHFPAPVARVNLAGTWALRGSVAAASLALVILLRKRRRLAPERDEEAPVVGEADEKTA